MPTPDVQYQDDEKEAMARAAAALLARWGVSDAEAVAQLGRACSDQTCRTAMLFGIHAALRQIFPDADRAARWINATNAAFNGKSAIEVMLAGGVAGMQRMRSYLNAEIAG